MKKVKDTRKPNEGMASIVDNDDFIKLVEMAERADYLEREFRQYYRAACQQEASKPYDLYDPSEIQELERVASWLRIDLGVGKHKE